MASLKEIAIAAGVSSRTVTRVLNGGDRVAPETRVRVSGLVERLGYHPDPTARALRTGRSEEVNVLIAMHDELYMARMEAFENLLRVHGYSVALLFCGGARDDESIVDGALEAIIRRRPAAVAVFPFVPDTIDLVVARLCAENIPYVTIDQHDPAYDTVRIDRGKGVSDAIRYLYGCGKRRIAYFGPLDDRTRVDPYERVMSELGLEPILVEAPSPLGVDAEECIDRLLACDPRPDAVQAFADVVAMELLAGLHERGVCVPQDLAVVGFDDRVMAALACPALTTIAHPNRDVGDAAAEILLAKIQNRSAPAGGWSRELPTKLIVREST